MPGQPYLPLYTGDLLRDEGASSLSLAAFGVWIKILCRMWESEQWSLTRTPEQFGKQCNAYGEDVTPLLRELDETGTADVEWRDDGTLTVTSRRMARDIPAMQERRSKSTERVKRFRNADETQSVTHLKRERNAVCNAPVPDNDIEDEDGSSSDLKGGAGGKGRPATVEDVWNYSALVHLPDHAAEFFDHFEAAGWRMGNGTGRPMKDWQAAYRNWCRRAPQFAIKTGSNNGRHLTITQQASRPITDRLVEQGYSPDDFR